MKKCFNFTILLVFLTMIAMSCESEADVISPDNSDVSNDYEVSIINDAGNKMIIESSKNGNSLNSLKLKSENDKIMLVDSDGNQFVINSSEKNELLDSFGVGRNCYQLTS